MPKPRLLDLFCGAGGATVGYHRAGFDIIGVDHLPQPNYPFRFRRCDALEWVRLVGLDRIRDEFDAIHASPPCQFHTDMQAVARNQDAHEDLIGPTRQLLEQTGLPYVIENVQGARPAMRDPFMLCGAAFGLGVDTDRGDFLLRRHRLFETNWPVGLVPPCCCAGGRVIGIYGDHARVSRRHNSQSQFNTVDGLRYSREAMGIDWMTWAEIKEAIPPAYTEWIGAELLAHIRQGVAA